MENHTIPIYSVCSFLLSKTPTLCLALYFGPGIEQNKANKAPPSWSLRSTGEDGKNGSQLRGYKL